MRPHVSATSGRKQESATEVTPFQKYWHPREDLNLHSRLGPDAVFAAGCHGLPVRVGGLLVRLKDRGQRRHRSTGNSRTEGVGRERGGVVGFRER